MHAMRIYFAYGSNMDDTQMARRCPDARLVGPAALPEHRFFITKNGWASVRPDSSHTVWGLLWQLSQRDEDALDLWEDVENGLYTKEARRIIPRKGDPCDALVYVERSIATGIPPAWYMERVVASADRHRLPEDYVQSLRNWMP
jgi:hypothetical protein